MSVTCSAPGKILLAGGYLVLDPAYSGLVLSLSSRIYTTVCLHHDDERISVASPQFKGALWHFKVENGLLVCSSPGNDNIFIRETLAVVLLYFDCLGKTAQGIRITIHADNQYYSLQNEPGKRFASSTTTISESPKTGLGSSAALVTSLTAALYVSFSSSNELRNEDQWRIHNLAQIAHCKAQGKVGSGFDVASATFGSCIYSRFEQKILTMSAKSETEVKTLQELVNQIWPMSVVEAKLNRVYKLIMGDVAQGSSTPGMVKKVMASKEALDLWPSLSISNELLVEKLTSDSIEIDTEVQEITRTVRALLKQMGVLSGADIEPDSRTTVLDQTLAVPGVVCCGVPGAGGFDAIFAIIRKDKQGLEEQIASLWSNNGIRRLDVVDSPEGVKLEQNFLM